MKNHIRINRKDNVFVALTPLHKGDLCRVMGEEITLQDDIAMGHKVALNLIKNGDNIIKYGYPIGHAVQDIQLGCHVHSHNIKTNLKGTLDYSYDKISFKDHSLIDDSLYRNEHFLGYRRKDGGAGVRNELWIIPTVGCVNGTADRIVDRFKEMIGIGVQENPPGIDWAGVFKHNNGCSQMGDDLENTRVILKDMVKHPNAGGVLILGLGCEFIQMDEFLEYLGSYDKDRTRQLVTHKVGNEVEESARLMVELYETMKDDKRQEIPLSELKIGLKCGGSDGMSGLTANPLLGEFSDYLTARGGTTVLTEVPEMFGAETILMNRAENRLVFDKIVTMINDFKKFCDDNGQVIYENPSPGNKMGGITTLEDKSLGCTQKSGHSRVTDVIKYGDPIAKSGLNLLDCPSNDLVASTGEAAAGCQMVLFTTGRGTPFGSFVPTVKVSTNTPLAELKPHWIDFNAGSLAEGTTLADLTTEFVEYVKKVASGEWTINEKNGFRELAIFKSGVTL
jgi:altronate hydrolase